MNRALDQGWRAALMRLRQWRHDRGSVAVLTALMIVPLTFALGLAYDYTMASNRKDQIDGMADAAALGAVTPDMMAQSSTIAQTRATSLFIDQIQTVSGATYSPNNIIVTVTDTPLGATITRNVSITYKAASPNVFAGVLGLAAFQISGDSSATSGGAPNIDFYLLLDDSPSMEIAATTQRDIEHDGLPTQASRAGARSPATRPTRAAEQTPTSGCSAHNDPATGHSTTACQYLTSTYQQIPCTVAGSYADGTAFTKSAAFPESGRDNYAPRRGTPRRHPAHRPA